MHLEAFKGRIIRLQESKDEMKSKEFFILYLKSVIVLIPLCPQKEAFLINVSFEERKEISSGNSKSTIPGCSSRRLINQNCLISSFCSSIPGEK